MKCRLQVYGFKYARVEYLFFAHVSEQILFTVAVAIVMMWALEK